MPNGEINITFIFMAEKSLKFLHVYLLFDIKHRN
jgi:hypothetical protein